MSAATFGSDAIWACHSHHFLTQPFVDESHFLHQFFPPRVWAIRIPVILLVIAFGIVGTFVSSVMIKQAEKEKKKLAAKKST